MSKRRFQTIVAAVFIPIALAQQSAPFDYDRSVPFHYQDEPIRTEPRFTVVGAGIESPRGDKINMVVVRPRGDGALAALSISMAAAPPCLSTLPKRNSWRA